MKYKLAFVDEINRHGPSFVWYLEEILGILRKYGMDPSKVKAVNQLRWYPAEVFAALEK